MKRKIILILIFLVVLIGSTGITYSLFTSESTLVLNQKIATFIFETEKMDSIELPINDMMPGDSIGYQFQVANNLDSETSEVTINYQIIIKTYHFMPLKIELYKDVSGKEELILECTESYSRNSDNLLICNSEVQKMVHSEEVYDEYKLNVSFPSTYNDEKYSDLVDFIDIEIKSWQATS